MDRKHCFAGNQFDQPAFLPTLINCLHRRGVWGPGRGDRRNYDDRAQSSLGWEKAVGAVSARVLLRVVMEMSLMTG